MTTHNAQLVEEFVTMIPSMPGKNQGFAKSMADQFKKKGSLSEKQWYWVEKLLREVISPPAPPEAVQVGKFSKVYELMHKAKENLKWPKMRLQIADPSYTPLFEDSEPEYLPVVFGMSGKNSKRPGTIHMTDGGPFGDNRFFGWIGEDGSWTQPQNMDDKVAAGLRSLLHALAEDPMKTLSEYGSITGNCSCCGSGLTSDNSVAMGIGPVCAKNYGLHEQWKKAAKTMGLKV